MRGLPSCQVYINLPPANQGSIAFRHDVPSQANPFTGTDSAMARQWLWGWMQAAEENYRATNEEPTDNSDE